jgi:hypothetical protein
MKKNRGLFLIFLAFLASAIIMRFWVAPQATQLPADYMSETRSLVEDHFRASESSDWEIANLTNYRADRVLSVTGEMMIVQGNLSVYTISGDPIFESNSLYGVNRLTRMNVQGYGDTNRSGQFLFPPQIKPATVEYWDPMFIGPRTAIFDRTEELDGLPTYVFKFIGTGMDETAGYDYMQDVPELYQAFTDGQGFLWIEPVSGVVVDYQEQGQSYFVDPKTGESGAVFHTWSGDFSDETRTAQRILAESARLRTLFFYDWLPAALILIGLTWLVTGLARHKQHA